MVSPSPISPSQPSSKFAWPFWPVVPLYPYGQRRTLRQEIIPGELWIFEQLQGILSVVTPIRMTVVRLAAGGLLVYAPVAPTHECLELLQELVDQYGTVTYIVLPTVSGIEHKVFVGPFARQFPTAQVWVAPHQWSFPVNLPLSWLGLPLGRTYKLPTDSSQTPFAEEFDYAILGPIDLGLGPFEEVAFFHRRSRTLLVTDVVIAIPATPPAIVQLDPQPLLFHAQDHAGDRVENNFENRLKGWQRIALFSVYFRPSALEILPWAQAWRSRQPADDAPRLYLGLYPFRWKANWHQSFEQLQGSGQLLVAPILQRLILNRAPQATLNWVERVCRWEFQHILSCHFQAPLQRSPQEFRQAFAFLQGIPQLPEADFELLQTLESWLERLKVTPPKVE